MVEIKDNETVDDLLISGLKIIQKARGFRFSLDAVLLAHFVTVKEKDKVIDLGTGTGIIPLLLTTRAKGLDLTGVEIQKEIAEMAQRSMILNGLNEIKIMNEDLRQIPKSFNGQYDLVVANPPYLPLNQGKISPLPEVAISRHEIKCSLEELVRTAARLLKPQGRFALIHKSDRLTELMLVLKANDLEPRRMRLIHPKLEKNANLVLLEARKGAQPYLEVLNPLIVYERDGSYSQELLEYYLGGESR